ncbi:MAG: hypothetical protein LBG14_03710 [Treponema sp.]|jgi:hypothetical protein|nr:hypothetical protein [Treponema sp.]
MYEDYLKEWEPYETGYFSALAPPDKNGSRFVEPKRHYPVSEKENFKLLFEKKKPVYMPVITEMTAFAPRVVIDNVARVFAMEIEPLMPGSPDAKSMADMFGVEWQYVPITGGSMVKPENPKIKDINRWEEYITFPNLDEWDWEGSAKKNAPLFHKDRMLRVWLMNGLNERLISMMDFDRTMIAYIDDEQKEGVHRFFDRLCVFYDDLIGRFKKHFDADVLMFNDDWGTQRGPQFSPDTAREMLAPYIRRIVESCHKRGMYFELHCCGKNDMLVDVMAESNIDLWAPQEINDFDLLYRLTAGRFALVVPFDVPEGTTEDQAKRIAEDIMERYGKNRDMIVAPPMMFGGGDPQPVLKHLYCLSREAYKA